jgi:hypothetical protein
MFPVQQLVPNSQTRLELLHKGSHLEAAGIPVEILEERRAQSYRLLLQRLAFRELQLRAAALCRKCQLPRGAQWLPRIGNNHSLVSAKLRFTAWSKHGRFMRGSVMCGCRRM